MEGERGIGDSNFVGFYADEGVNLWVAYGRCPMVV